MPLRETYADDKIHDQWASAYRRSPIQDRFNDAIASRIFQYLKLPHSALFLDAGCGSGEHTIRIARRGYSCIGVDISENVLCRAASKVAAEGLASKVTFACHPLEDLPFAEATFDAVHCRGVLMHIPEWRKALANLCRVLKPGGRIVIMENNHRSLETRIVLLVRRVQARKSRLLKTRGGLEFWSEESGEPFVARVANVRALTEELESNGICVCKRFAAGFWDVGRFPSGAIRNAVVRCNQLYFSLGLPAALSVGNAIIGEKKRTSAKLSDR